MLKQSQKNPKKLDEFSEINLEKNSGLSSLFSTPAEEIQFLKNRIIELSLVVENQDQTIQNQDQTIQKKDQKIIEQYAEIQSLTEKAVHYSEEYDKLIQAFKQAQRDRFGRKSERFTGAAEQLTLFDPNPDSTHENAQNENETEDPSDAETITYTRKRNPKTKQYDGIPVREVIIEEQNKTCDCCGNQKEVIRYESSQRLNYQPAVFEFLIEKREVVACRKGCAGSVKTATLPKRILPKCSATESLLAYIAVCKFLDRQPLYHLENLIKQRYGWHISRQTMARWLIQLADELQPLINLMKDEILDYDIASIDATTLQVLNEPERLPDQKSYAYCIRGGPPEKAVTLYEYNAYSHKEYVVETFANFKGYIHCDGAPVFNEVGKQQAVTLSYCHAHARRKFEQIVKQGGKKESLAKQAMQFYHRLYAVERDAKNRNLRSEDRYVLRLQQSRPILDEFKIWLDIHQNKVLPQSPIGKAIAYARNHWNGLIVFLKDGRMELDNNATERDIKPFVIARKNFLFSCTQAGADSLGVLFSLIITARHHKLDPYHYLESVFKLIPYRKTITDLESLLPWNFKNANP